MVTGPWGQAIDWIVTDRLPRALVAGLNHLAHIISPEPLAQLSAENLRHRIRGTFQMQIFEGAPPAEEWLKQMQSEILTAKM